jgi:hypothetical protein
MMLVTLYPSADLAHAAAMLPAFLPLLARAVNRLQARTPTRRGAAIVALATLAFVVPPVRLLADAVADRPADRDGLPRASGIWQRGDRFGEAVRFSRLLEARFPPGTPMLAVPSQQTLYFVLGRPSVLENEEFVFYLASFGLIADADARALANEDAMLDRLRQTRPFAVQYTGDPALDRMRRAFPRLTAFLATHYRPTAAVGGYTLLEWSDAGDVDPASAR